MPGQTLAPWCPVSLAPVPVTSARHFSPRLRCARPCTCAQEKQITEVIGEETVHLAVCPLNGFKGENGKGSQIGGNLLFPRAPSLGGVRGWGRFFPVVRHLLRFFLFLPLGASYPAPRRGRGEEARGGPAAPCQRRRRRRARQAPRPHLWLVSGLRGLSWPGRRQVSSM